MSSRSVNNCRDCRTEDRECTLMDSFLSCLAADIKCQGDGVQASQLHFDKCRIKSMGEQLSGVEHQSASQNSYFVLWIHLFLKNSLRSLLFVSPTCIKKFRVLKGTSVLHFNCFYDTFSFPYARQAHTPELTF